MKQSYYIQQVLDAFKQSFPVNWIEDLNLDDKSKSTQNYKKGLSQIINFRQIQGNRIKILLTPCE